MLKQVPILLERLHLLRIVSILMRMRAALPLRNLGSGPVTVLEARLAHSLGHGHWRCAGQVAGGVLAWNRRLILPSRSFPSLLLPLTASMSGRKTALLFLPRQFMKTQSSVRFKVVIMHGRFPHLVWRNLASKILASRVNFIAIIEWRSQFRQNIHIPPPNVYIYYLQIYFAYNY